MINERQINESLLDAFILVSHQSLPPGVTVRDFDRHSKRFLRSYKNTLYSTSDFYRNMRWLFAKILRVAGVPERDITSQLSVFDRNLDKFESAPKDGSGGLTESELSDFEVLQRVMPGQWKEVTKGDRTGYSHKSGLRVFPVGDGGFAARIKDKNGDTRKTGFGISATGFGASVLEAVSDLADQLGSLALEAEELADSLSRGRRYI